MHGFQNFLMNIALNPELIQTLVNKMTDFYMEMNERIFSALKGKIDIWFWGNDYGGQSGLLFNETMFESIFLPNIMRLNNLAHNHGLKVMMHSCGSIVDLIPTLIDSGVDILDPIQVTADNMEPEKLKDKFGDAIVFHGAIDTQQVLPSESPEGVYQHAEQTLEILGKNGGYIFAPSQILQPDVPAENIDAMYRAAKEYKSA
jgi:uroporphyrinogen decarboxylase